ncbi:MAG: sterol desaturase family protein [Bdellovibrionales bacterium]|nr:sterol desaturase family protein [Bdellovibrionales bacterium]
MGLNLRPEDYAVLSVFWLLLFFSVRDPNRLKHLISRNKVEWGVDLFSLILQGFLIPLAAARLLAPVLLSLFPQGFHVLDISWIGGFLLRFVFVDYLYYWNHRLLHNDKLWPIHRVHHSAESMDVLITSRNSIWTPVFIVYIWSDTAFLFLLLEPSGYLAGMALNNILDLWRHSGFRVARSAWLRWTGGILILPDDHEWHHSRHKYGVNFGANWAFWDRFHGTFFGEPLLGKAEMPLGETRLQDLRDQYLMLGRKSVIRQ